MATPSGEAGVNEVTAPAMPFSFAVVHTPDAFIALNAVT